jgi:hypothetical protein
MEVDLSKQLPLNSWIDAESRVSGGRAGRLFLWIESVDEVLSCHGGSKDSKRKPSTVFAASKRMYFCAFSSTEAAW